MVFDTRQRRLIESDKPRIMCIASASSGKTATLTERIRRLIIDKKVEPKDIVAITFTKLAATEMRIRLEDVATEDMFIGTVHAYALKVCGLNEISMYTAIDQEEYDKILRTAIQLPSSKYVKVKHLLIDESQDLTALEYAFIDKIPTENIFYVGDPRQCIYQFKGGSDRYIIEKYEDPTYTNYFLDNNYRNPPNILEFANNFLKKRKKYGPESNPVKTENGVLVDDITLQEALEEIYSSNDWGNWAILTRTNNESEVVQFNLYKHKVDSITFKKSDFDNPEQIDRALAENAVKVLTMHTAKGLEFPNVIVVGARVYNDAEANLAYVAATRAKNGLYWCKPIAAPKGKARSTNINWRKRYENDPEMIDF